MDKRTSAVVGGGPAGLMAAEVLADAGFSVVIYERMPRLARKFLLAGRGGLNVSHSEPRATFIGRYGAAAGRVAGWIDAFSPDALSAWCSELGEPTFVGSSARVFPKSFKASPLLRAWLRRLDTQGVTVKFGHHFAGWDTAGRLRFATEHGEVRIAAAAVVLAMGGASWPRLGSDGGWAPALEERHIGVARLRPSNCGFDVAWSDAFASRFAGTPLKNIALHFGSQDVRGEALVTRAGLEGGAVYALSPRLRDAIETEGETLLHVDLKPDVSEASLMRRLGAVRGGQTMTNFLRKSTALPPVAIALLREAAGPDLPRDAEILARLIKRVPVRLVGIAPITRAISTAGGVELDEVDETLMLRSMPGVFVAGEMLDWEAPTGGYLLHAVLASGRAAGAGAARWLTGDLLPTNSAV